MGKKKRKPTSDERVAYHEAGHVVMRYLLRLRFTHVTIKQDELEEDFLGRVCPPSFSENFYEELEFGNPDKRKVERIVKAGLAGEVAEALLVGRNNWLGARTDIEKCTELLWRLHNDAELVDAHLKYLFLCVKGVLRHPLNWFYVQSVAQALLEHRRLGYRKVRSIIAEAKATKLSPVRIG